MCRFNQLPKFCNTFVSIEPILEDLKLAEHNVMFQQANWIIIGAETGHRKGKAIPCKEWIEDIVQWCDKSGIPVFMKDSLIPIVGECDMRRDFPEQLLRSEISPKMKKKLFSTCAECKTELKKRDMITLLARSRRGEQPKQFGFMCKDCFKQLCNDLNLELPEFMGMSESITREEESEYGEEKKLQTHN